jgi:hypothetical protein
MGTDLFSIGSQTTKLGRESKVSRLKSSSLKTGVDGGHEKGAFWFVGEL